MPEQGIVRWYSIAKGYGFIKGTTAAPETDIFVHYSDIAGEPLSEGGKGLLRGRFQPQGTQGTQRDPGRRLRRD